jgi:hypothetical protein
VTVVVISSSEGRPYRDKNGASLRSWENKRPGVSAMMRMKKFCGVRKLIAISCAVGGQPTETLGKPYATLRPTWCRNTSSLG